MRGHSNATANRAPQLLRESVATLTDTLKHVEAISNDVSSMTGDSATKQNLRHLIQSLSRLVSD